MFPLEVYQNACFLMSLAARSCVIPFWFLQIILEKMVCHPKSPLTTTENIFHINGPFRFLLLCIFLFPSFASRALMFFLLLCKSLCIYVLRIMSLVAIASSFLINCMVFGGTFKFSYSLLYCFIHYFTFNIMHANIFPTPQLYVLLYFWVPLPSLF